jgi:hypothetical protein
VGFQLCCCGFAREKGNGDEAFYHVERALAVNPNLIEAHFVLASAANDRCLLRGNPGVQLILKFSTR